MIAHQVDIDDSFTPSNAQLLRLRNGRTHDVDMKVVEEQEMEPVKHFTEQVEAVLWAASPGRRHGGVLAETEDLVTVPHLPILVTVGTRGR